MPARHLRVLDPDVHGEGVAAEYRGGRLGVGADDRDHARPVERQGAVVAQQHHALLGDPAGDVPVGGRVQVHAAAQRLPVQRARGRHGGVRVVDVAGADRRTRTRIRARPRLRLRAVPRRRPPRSGHPVDAPGQHLRHRVPSRVQQPELGLLHQHPVHRPVQQRLRHPSAGDRLEQRLAVRLDGGQFDVHARRERRAGRLPEGARHAVQGLEEGDAEVVGDDGPGEAPSVAEQPGQQLLVGRRRDAVGVGVGVHHRADAALAHRHLERRQDDVGALPAAHADRREVAARAGGGVAREVLEGGDDPGRLQPPHVGGADRADQVRVLADGLLDPAPARVAHHVQHRREPLVHADRPHVAADPLGHGAHQRGVEGRAPGQRHRVGGGAPGGEARQALLVGERGDAEPARGHDPALGAQQRQRAERRVDRCGAERPGELAQAVRQQLVEGDRFLHLVLVGGDFATFGGGAHPDSVQLRGLLRQGHLGDQGVGPGRGWQGGVPPAGDGRGGVSRGGLFGHGLFGHGLFGHGVGHFPPTPISPCTRARRANR